ncbi:hypothetical protein M406DRAFT_75449 [Cryphonectria parasitica EP155]|uniref:Uncharacterized protein n=1 Tax=Cryphonectria parasitica (strain ATCC 38755 / EP155) TaxID=660469 RepID=A0A9P4XSX5_CRYP1|nr:uncharacterized protein M406DRAFT_75449 [Cryphonectria parasitica EP155]KAF3760095.1 hypothetical protein M406DRAFT_75449 [Cryphonectria parasitica EP155]
MTSFRWLDLLSGPPDTSVLLEDQASYSQFNKDTDTISEIFLWMFIVECGLHLKTILKHQNKSSNQLLQHPLESAPHETPADISHRFYSLSLMPLTRLKLSQAKAAKLAAAWLINDYHQAEGIIDECYCSKINAKAIVIRPPTAGLRIIKLKGGDENVESLSHVMLQLREHLKSPLYFHFNLIIGKGFGLRLIYMVFCKEHDVPTKQKWLADIPESPDLQSNRNDGASWPRVKVNLQYENSREKWETEFFTGEIWAKVQAGQAFEKFIEVDPGGTISAKIQGGILGQHKFSLSNCPCEVSALAQLSKDR